MIVLITDFGLFDPYVGIMKGVINKISPGTNIIDLCHNLPPQSIKTGTFYLQHSYFHFPEKTIFCAVIDPGVGGPRKAILVETEKYYFVGPDNGLFSFLIDNKTDPPVHMYNLDNSDYYYTKSPDNTFHGRDIFAPVAAHLEKGVSANQMGSILPDFITNTPLEAFEEDDRLCVPLLHIDHFGNLIFSLTPGQLKDFTAGKEFSIRYKDVHISKIDTTYESRENLICLFNSYGLLEIALNSGSAAVLTNSAITKEEKLYIYKNSDPSAY